MKYPHLLGKWRSYDRQTETWFEPRGFLLEAHIAACVRMFLFLFDVLPFGRLLYRVSALPKENISYKKFRSLCLLAVICHDLGKANSEFERMLWEMEWHWKDTRQLTTERYQQRVRHEFLSFLLLTKPEWPYWEWLVAQTGGNEESAWLVACAAFGHHRKTNRHLDLDPGRGPVELYLKDLGEILKPVFELAGLDPLPQSKERWIEDSDTKSATGKLHGWLLDRHDALEPFQEELKNNPEKEILPLLLKAVVILSDTLGSMTATHEADLPDFEERLKKRLQAIYAPREIDFHARIARWDTVRSTLHPFQTTMAGCSSDAVVCSDTGGGKSTAGLLGASCRPNTPLIFTGATTLSASDLYINNSVEEKDGLRHSMTALDEAILEPLGATVASNNESSVDGASEDEDAENFNTADENSVDRTLGKFTEVTYTTVDQLLGFLAFNHKSILWLLHIVQSQIIFDEYHSYDSRLAGYFHQFLSFFPGVRAMYLSASASEEQIKSIVSRRRNTAIIKGKRDTEPRFFIHLLESKEEAYQYFTWGGLWLCNTIASAQETGMRLKDSKVLHSRRRRMERRELERKLVSQFRTDPKSLQLVATQVAEMSLDISAILGVIEVCPLANFMQRLGRICRMHHARLVDIAHIYVYMPKSPYPYVFAGVNKDTEAKDCAEYKAYWEWIKALSGRPISQADVAEAFHKAPDAYWERNLPPKDLYHTYATSLRKTHPTFLGFLKSDVKEHPELGNERSWKLAQQLEIPLTASEKNLRGLEYIQNHYVLDWKYDHRLGLIIPGSL